MPVGCVPRPVGALTCLATGLYLGRQTRPVWERRRKLNRQFLAISATSRSASQFGLGAGSAIDCCYRRTGAMKRTTVSLIAGVAVALLLAGSITLSHAAGPAGMKLYAFSSGGLTIAKSALQAGAPSTQVTVPVGFYVVMHPMGNFLFDTGNN